MKIFTEMAAHDAYGSSFNPESFDQSRRGRDLSGRIRPQPSHLSNSAFQSTSSALRGGAAMLREEPITR
jgi:hypothetical protein